METILIFAAHPDDVAACVGGTVLRLGERYRLHVACATRGERGRKDWTMDETAAVRTKEEQAACAVLGAELTFLDRIDGELYADREICQRAAALVRELTPAAVFTLWPIDEHPDHAAVGDIARKALRQAESKAELIYYEAGFARQAAQFDPDVYVDITDVMDRKLQAVRCHACQNRDDAMAEGFIRQASFRGGQARCTYAEGFKLGLPPCTTRRSVLWGLG